jgi:uncharacterized protein YcfL
MRKIIFVIITGLLLTGCAGKEIVKEERHSNIETILVEDIITENIEVEEILVETIE